MKAVSIKDKGEVQIEELPVPEPPPQMVRLKVLYCSICGADVERLYGGHWEKMDEEKRNIYLRGTILGHEYVAQVESLGEGVTGFSVGDRVIDVHSCCGWCYYCIRGMGDLCMGGRVRGYPYDGKGTPQPGSNRWGAMTEYIVRPANRLLKVPDSVSDQEAAMCEPLATGVTGVKAAETGLANSAAVVGVGHIGLMVVAAAKAAGAAPLIAIDKIDARLEAARRVGADIILNPNDTDIVEAVVDITEAGLDIVFSCVSFRVEGILEQAFEMVRRRGRIIIVGAPAPARLHTGAWLAKEVRIQGALHMGQEMVPALKLLQYKRANLEPSITEIVPLEEAQRAFDSLHSQKNIAVLLKP